jgi:drug/metabolite transporter (DMT)-like permease
VDRRGWTLLIALAAIWGASFLLIKIALRDVGPAVIVCARTGLGAIVLLPVAVRGRSLVALRGRWGWAAALAVVHLAGPFLLISLGERHVSSSLTGILLASAPIFTALLALRFARGERAGPVGAAGIAVGIAGVALLLGVDVGGGSALGGALLILLAGLGYAIGGMLAQAKLGDVPAAAVSAATLSLAALVTLPLAIADAPANVPGIGPVAALVALGAIGTGVAFLLFYDLNADVGAARSSLVAYMSPGFAVVYGALLLGERITLATLAGLALILAGSWLAASRRLLPWRRTATAGAVAAGEAPATSGAPPAT